MLLVLDGCRGVHFACAAARLPLCLHVAYLGSWHRAGVSLANMPRVCADFVCGCVSSQVPLVDTEKELQDALADEARVEAELNLARDASRARVAALQLAAETKAAETKAAEAARVADIEAKLAESQATMQALQDQLAAARSGAHTAAVPPAPTPEEIAHANAAASTGNWISVAPTEVLLHCGFYGNLLLSFDRVLVADHFWLHHLHWRATCAALVFLVCFFLRLWCLWAGSRQPPRRAASQEEDDQRPEGGSSSHSSHSFCSFRSSRSSRSRSLRSCNGFRSFFGFTGIRGAHAEPAPIRPLLSPFLPAKLVEAPAA